MPKQVSFPGFGIGPLTLDPDAFVIPDSVIPDFIMEGDLAIKWYALFIVCGMLIAALYVYLRSQKYGLLFDDLLDLAIYIVFPAVIGTRLYYVIFKKLEDPSTYTTFKEVINIRDGGLAIYGGIITGAIMTFTVLAIKKMRIAPFVDIIAPAVMIAQAIGRWGNFMNVEAYGSETTLPWRMGIVQMGEWIYVHPTFLYESLWNLTGFLLLMLLYKRKKFDGQICLSYVAWYGFGRMFIEGLRTDSLYIGSTGIRVSQLLAAICFVGALTAIIVLSIRLKDKPLATCLYTKKSKHYKEALKAKEQYEKECKRKLRNKEKKRKEKEAARQNKNNDQQAAT